MFVVRKDQTGCINIQKRKLVNNVSSNGINDCYDYWYRIENLHDGKDSV